MNNFLELVQKRQSVRKYSDKAVEKEIMDSCLQAAMLAPSACNAQPWKYIVVDKAETKGQVAKACYSSLMSFNKFVEQAPILVVIVMEKANFTSTMGQVIKDIDYPLIDVGISAEHFCLQATELGLGTCLLGWFQAKIIQDILIIAIKKKIALVISVGYAPEDYKQREKTRKPIKEVQAYNQYE
jgi:nitroreductase